MHYSRGALISNAASIGKQAGGHTTEEKEAKGSQSCDLRKTNTRKVITRPSYPHPRVIFITDAEVPLEVGVRVKSLSLGPPRSLSAVAFA